MDKVIKDFLKYSDLRSTLKDMSNKALCKMLLDHVWGVLDSTTIQAALIGEAIHRLKIIDQKYDCSEWHKANQDKDEICAYCNKPFNPDF